MSTFEPLSGRGTEQRPDDVRGRTLAVRLRDGSYDTVAAYAKSRGLNISDGARALIAAGLAGSGPTGAVVLRVDDPLPLAVALASAQVGLPWDELADEDRAEYLTQATEALFVLDGGVLCGDVTDQRPNPVAGLIARSVSSGDQRGLSVLAKVIADKAREVGERALAPVVPIGVTTLWTNSGRVAHTHPNWPVLVEHDHNGIGPHAHRGGELSTAHHGEVPDGT